jgi:hypothetical protein
VTEIKVISPIELDDHLSAWISPGGTIYRVDECNHYNVALAMNTTSKELEAGGWIHLSYGSIQMDDSAEPTEPQLTVLSVIKLVRVPQISPRWECTVNNFLREFERILNF